MSASDTNPIVLSGDFVEIASVSGIGSGSETVELISETMGEIAFSKESEVVEAQLHSQALTVRNRTHYTLDTEFQMTVTPGVPELESAGLVDSNGEYTGPSTHEAIRFSIYSDEPSGQTPQAVFNFFGVELDFDEINLAVGDPGEISVTGFVSSGWNIGGATP